MDKDVIANKLPSWLRDNIISKSTREDFYLDTDDINRKRDIKDFCDESLMQKLKLSSGMFCWKDHWGLFVQKHDKGEMLSSEPYGLSSDSINQLILFCEKYDCRFAVNGNSQHHRDAISILVFQKQ